MRDRGPAAVARGRGVAQVAFRIQVGLAGDEDDVGGWKLVGEGAFGGGAVASQWTRAFRPGEEVTGVVGVREREHDAQDGPAFAQEADGDRAAAAAGQVVASPVVGIDEPDGLPRLAGLHAGLLAPISPSGERRGEPRSDLALGLRVRVRLVAAAARTARAMEVGAQPRSGLERRLHRDGKRAIEHPPHCSGLGAMTARRRGFVDENGPRAYIAGPWHSSSSSRITTTFRPTAASSSSSTATSAATGTSRDSRLRSWARPGASSARPETSSAASSARPATAPTRSSAPWAARRMTTPWRRR